MYNFVPERSLRLVYGDFYLAIGEVTTQVGRLKTVRKNGNTAHFETMFGAKSCSLSTNVRQLCFSGPLSLQSKQDQPDCRSSHSERRYIAFLRGYKY